ncbi:hypothetical protein PVMG_05970 [Plasmodium vivax Mauritania I]|uniref:VIR protein n=1 Tax=Plasmodium vivax Mauritania I TaxID=1035515 RepID=A0A0J9W425_PLAVI|nr:hypothetical protein PVMG_05970 [Plasmodium vivax Mauritania I]
MVIKSLGLPSEEFYKKLNHDEDTNLQAYYKVCNSIFSTIKEFVLRRPCALLFKYLVNSYKKSEKEKPAYDDCILLNYWIYGKIYEQHKDISERARSYGELQIIWNILIQDKSKKPYNNICEPDILIATQEDWKKRKELYDYFVDYDTIDRMIGYYSTLCKEFYMYLKDMDVLYKEYREHCSKEDQNNCPDFFRECENKDPSILLKKLTCYGDMQRNDALLLKPVEKQVTAETDPGPTEAKANLLMGSQMADAGTNPVTKSGNVLLGVVVTSMTSGALYKFTPLGRMLRNGLGFNRNNINVHDNGLFDYAPGSFNPYSMGGDEHYIGYQPA